MIVWRTGIYDIRGLNMSDMGKYATGTRRIIHVRDTIPSNISRFIVNLVHEDEDLRYV
jgi:23S rRNA A2030 N6-methylase RlmJ